MIIINNISKDNKITKLYFSKFLFSYQQDILNNRISVIIAIILSIIAGILYFIYINKNFPIVIKFLTIIFILLYILEFSFPWTKHKELHKNLFIALTFFSQIYFIIIMLLIKNKNIKYLGLFLIFITILISLIAVKYIVPKAFNLNTKNKIKYSKIENILMIVLLIIISIVIYLIGLK